MKMAEHQRRIAVWNGVRIGFLISGILAANSVAVADEGGVSFWVPGLFGSLAAAPQQPGWSGAAIYYHDSVSASGATAASREVTIGGLSRNVTVDLNVNLH